MVFVHLHFRVIHPQHNLSFVGRACQPDFKKLSIRLQSNSLNIVINMTVDFKPIIQEQRGNGPNQLH